MAGAECARSPGRVLAGGEFFSEVIDQHRQDDVLLTELVQTAGGKTPHHEHELAYVTVVLDGAYAEITRLTFTELQTFTAIFNPVSVAHSGVFGRTGARLFTIEFCSQFLQRLDLQLPSYPVVDQGAGTMLWPAMTMFSAFKSETAGSLTIESCLVEMLGAAAASRTRGAAAPPWFHRVKERLHSAFRQNMRMADLAAEAGVHPVHLARVFRAQEKQTPGEYVQRLRIRAACQLLRDREMSLAGVAADCGFADQSHFTRTFKQAIGSTPGRFRQMLLRKPAQAQARQSPV
jgi:AraC family transcriptional regulator